MRRKIRAEEFMDALATALGVDNSAWRRVVIDAQLNKAVAIYIEMRGTEDILGVTQTLEGIEITIAGKEVSD